MCLATNPSGMAFIALPEHATRQKHRAGKAPAYSASASASASAPLAGRFEVGRQIGTGAFSSVYAGSTTCPRRRKVAIKKIRAGAPAAGLAPLAEFLLGRALRHPNIVETLDCVVGAEDTALILELTNGGDLFAKLEPGAAPLLEADAKRYAAGAAAGLVHMHAQGLVHSDLKPENVLLHDGAAKICDFGLAAAAGSRRRGPAQGTGAYMAPELFECGPEQVHTLSQANDVWSFGVLLYACLFRDLPCESARASDPDCVAFTECGGLLHPGAGRALADAPGDGPEPRPGQAPVDGRGRDGPREARRCALVRVRPRGRRARRARARARARARGRGRAGASCARRQCPVSCSPCSRTNKSLTPNQPPAARLAELSCRRGRNGTE